MIASDEARRLLLTADVVVPHTDADGHAAGALLLRARGAPRTAVLLGRGRTPSRRATAGSLAPEQFELLLLAPEEVRPVERAAAR